MQKGGSSHLMDNHIFNQRIRDKFHDLESPFNDRVSFEAVMQKRERKKRRIIFWIPSWVIVAGLFLAVGAGLIYNNRKDLSLGELKSKQASVAQLVHEPVKKHDNILTKSSQNRFDKNIEITENKSLSAIKNNEPRKHSSKYYGVGSIKQNESEIIGFQKEVQNNIGTLNVVFQGVSDGGETILNKQQLIEAIAYFNLAVEPREIYPVTLDHFGIKQHFPEIPEGEYERTWDPNAYLSKWYSEFAVSTGSKTALDFDPADTLSILGTIYHANYQGLIMKDIGRGFLLGTGICYGELNGHGEWRLTVNNKTTQSKINYSVSKWSVPIALRYYKMFGRIQWRFGFQLNPGITTKTSGLYFSNKEYHELGEQRTFSLDAKFNLGPAIMLSKEWTLILEPNAMMHSFYDQTTQKNQSNVLTGFGISLVKRLGR